MLEIENTSTPANGIYVKQPNRLNGMEYWKVHGGASDLYFDDAAKAWRVVTSDASWSTTELTDDRRPPTNSTAWVQTGPQGTIIAVVTITLTCSDTSNGYL